MVLNSKRSLLFQPSSTFKRKEIYALIEHEIGIHMVTTLNSSNQDLKIFNLGLPVNTYTQEGLAILSEYLSGNITLDRLRILSLRVILVDMMCNGADFIECFHFLKNEHGMDNEDAFKMVTRIFRGGGFTKDHLYLSGFVNIYKFWLDENDINPLLVGKTSIEWYNTISEMIDRKMITPPNLITKSFIKPNFESNADIYDYILSGLKS